ncbi:MAG: nucleotidyltransferase domain-containing protein [Ignavibacteriae bacterium]|nr:nucleotidyltransferase domain-containing protein [Ignavibacteriota bacterium]
MDNREALTIAKRYAESINRKYDSVRVYLFGSYIRGNYHDDSDIDIAVVFKEYDNTLEIFLELMRLRRSIDSRIEPHPFREQDFTYSNPLACEILKYGKSIVR